VRTSRNRLICHITCATGLLLAIMSGCSSNKVNGSSAGSNAVNQPDGRTFQPTGAAICLQKMIKEPPNPFHLSFTEKSSDGQSSSVEGDVTSALVNYKLRESSNGNTTAKEKHWARNQLTELEIDFAIMGPVPWHGELAPVQSTAKPAGSERVNGYNTTKYSFDSALEPLPEKSTFLALLRAKDYRIKGAAWTTNDTGCLVKWAVDLHQDGKDGNAKETYYEGNVTKH